MTSVAKWMLLSKSVMELNEKNYAQQSNAIVIELQNLLQVESELCNNIDVSVLYILYERALRELVTSSFPVSANIIDALSNSSDDIFKIIQKLMREHFQELLKKLGDFSPLSCNDIGVMFLLLSIYRLDKVSGRRSSLISIIEMIIKKITNYIKSFCDFTDIDILVMMLYSLIHYSLHSVNENDETKLLVEFVRKILIKHGDLISNFTKVLTVDILEQFQDKDGHIQLYAAIYKKIFQPEIFIIPGLSKFITNVQYPENSTKYTHKVEEAVSTIKKTTISRAVSTSSVDEPLDISEMSRKEPDGQSSHSEEEEKEEHNENLSSDESKSPDFKWSISVLPHEDISEKTTEIITVPSKCIGRVLGFQGAIARKLEIESNAVIEVCPDEVQRPVTSCLTAHKLVTGCLGVPMQLPPHQIEEEKFKLSDAKIKRQSEGKQEKQRSIKITGSQNEINDATRLINDILTCVVTIHIPLDFTVDEIVHKYSGKLKTIEMLLNVFLEVEEQENEKVVLNISGDEQSCQDAKKLIFEELGSFRSQHGHLFLVPEEMMKVLKDEGGLSNMVETVQHITHGRIVYLFGTEGYAIFISGFAYQVSKALQIFQKTNSELLCCLSDTLDKTVAKDELNAEVICDFIKQSFGEIKRKDSFRPTLLKREAAAKEVKSRLIYSKQTLLELSSSKLSNEFPENMVIDDPVVKEIILDTHHPKESIKRLLKSL